MVDLEFSLTAGVFNVRPLKVTTESKKNGLVTLVENGLKVIIEPKKKKKKAKQAIKKEKKNFPDPCLKAITPEELRWKVINFSMIQLCKKKDIPDVWLYRRCCRQIDEHVTEKTFKTYMSLQIFDCNYRCYSRKEDLVSLEEYLMSNPAVKEAKSSSTVMDIVGASRDYKIMAEEKYIVITNLDVYTHPGQAGWVLFTFPGSNRTLGLKHNGSDLQGQDRVNLFFHMNGSTHVYRIDNPLPHPALSEDDTEDSDKNDEVGDDGEDDYDDDDDDDIGYLLADMSGNVITVPSSSDCGQQPEANTRISIY